MGTDTTMDNDLIEKSINTLTQFGIIDDLSLFPGETIVSIGGNLVYTPSALAQKRDELLQYWRQFSEDFEMATFDKIFKAPETPMAQWLNLSQARDYVQNWCKNPTGVLSILSNGAYKTPGGGKTILARCAATELINTGFPVVFWRVANMAQAWFSDGKNLPEDLRESFLTFGDLKAGLLHVGQRCPVLILDDFGLQYQSEFVDFFLNTLVLDRADNNKPTIVTSPFSIQDLDKQYPAIASRMKTRHVMIGVSGSHLDYRTLKI
jgi:DNA replication protein DnaC